MKRRKARDALERVNKGKRKLHDAVNKPQETVKKNCFSLNFKEALLPPFAVVLIFRASLLVLLSDLFMR